MSNDAFCTQNEIEEEFEMLPKKKMLSIKWKFVVFIYFRSTSIKFFFLLWFACMCNYHIRFIEPIALWNNLRKIFSYPTKQKPIVRVKKSLPMRQNFVCYAIKSDNSRKKERKKNDQNKRHVSGNAYKFNVQSHWNMNTFDMTRKTVKQQVFRE